MNTREPPPATPAARIGMRPKNSGASRAPASMKDHSVLMAGSSYDGARSNSAYHQCVPTGGRMPHLLVEMSGEAAVLTLDRPEKRNALNAVLRDEIADAIEAIDADEQTKVVVLTGAGSAFCAGFDLTEFDQGGDVIGQFAENPHNPFRFHEVLGAFSKPLVGAINGPALAGGFDLAAQCDVRIASDAAVFGHPEIKFGAPTIVSQLSHIVGGAIARDLCLSGRRIDATEAHRIGLVIKVVAADALMEEAIAYARAVSEAPLEALRTVKRAINQRAPFVFP